MNVVTNDVTKMQNHLFDSVVCDRITLVPLKQLAKRKTACIVPETDPQSRNLRTLLKLDIHALANNLDLLSVTCTSKNMIASNQGKWF